MEGNVEPQPVEENYDRIRSKVEVLEKAQGRQMVENANPEPQLFRTDGTASPYHFPRIKGY
jgi:hypothetical protein